MVLGDVGLAAHRVDGDEGARELEPLSRRGMAVISLVLRPSPPGRARGAGGRPRPRRGVGAPGPWPGRGSAARSCRRRRRCRASPSRRPATQAAKQGLKRSASSALTTSLNVSWVGMPRAKGRNRRRKPSRSSPNSGSRRNRQPRTGGAQHHQQHFGQRVDHLPGLTRIAERRKMVEQRGRRRRQLAWEAPKSSKSPMKSYFVSSRRRH